jgi:hypothetical protein
MHHGTSVGETEFYSEADTGNKEGWFSARNSGAASWQLVSRLDGKLFERDWRKREIK